MSLNWLGERSVKGLRVVVGRRANADRVTKVEVVHPGGRETVTLDRTGRGRLDPFRASEMQVRILETSSKTNHPRIGVSELRIEGTGLLPIQLSDVPRDIGCGFGPTLRVGSELFATTVVASAQELYRGDSLETRICTAGPVTMRDGSSRMVFNPAPAFRPERLVLSRPQPSAEASDPGQAPAAATLDRGSPVRAEVSWQPQGGQHLVTLRQNFNRGWVARGDDGDARPVVVDGWQQGWQVSGEESNLSLDYAPDRTYRVALAVGGGLLLLLILLTAIRRLWPATVAPLASAQVAWPEPVVGGLVLGLVTGWAGLACGLLGALIALVVRRWWSADAVAWLAGIPVVVVGALYWLRPLGSDDGWAGAWSLPHLLAAVAVGVVVSSVREDGAPRVRKDWNGPSTAR